MSDRNKTAFELERKFMILGVFWLIFALSAVLDVSWAIYLFFISICFGSFAIIPPSITGGTTFLPVTACSGLLLIKAFFKLGRPTIPIDGLLSGNRLGLLTAFITLSLIITFTSPFIFAGVPVMGLNSGHKSGLSFGSGNITQPLYLIFSFLVSISIYQLLINDQTRVIVFKAIMIGGAVSVIAGMADMATANTSILEPLRTATYQLMNDNMVGSARRVIGFNTEASGYGALTLSYLSLIYYMRAGRFIGGVFARCEIPLVFLLFLFTILSTSSAAYLGIIAFLGMAGFINVITPVTSEDRPRATLEILIIFGCVLFLAALWAIKPELFGGAFDMINRILLQKAGSDSYVERSSWNIVSLEGFRATYGYGLGVGSTRASSWPVIVISSCGVGGALLMVAFIVRICSLPLTGASVAMYRAAVGSRCAIVVCAVPGVAAGTLVDFGPFNATLFAVAAAIPCLVTPPRWLQNYVRPHSIVGNEADDFV